MAKYIDTDKIKDNAVFPYLGGDEEKRRIYREGFYRAMQCVERAEVEDVAPVIHAIWGKMRGGPAVCTNCKNWYGNAKGKTDQRFYQKFRYCPFCGAKMDGGENAKTDN